MAQLHLRVTGIKPLLTNNPASMSIEKPTGSKGKKVYVDEEEAEAGAYRLPNGTCALPGIAFRNSIINASSAWKSSRGKSTMKSILSHIEVEEELIPLLHSDDTPITDYSIDRRRAVIQRQGIIRCRPRFEDWGARFTITYDSELVSDPEIIVEIANDAGQRIGVGDYRPARGGWFGRFKAEIADAPQVKKAKTRRA